MTRKKGQQKPRFRGNPRQGSETRVEEQVKRPSRLPRALIVIGFLLLMVYAAIGIWPYFEVKRFSDFYVSVSGNKFVSAFDQMQMDFTFDNRGTPVGSETRLTVDQVGYQVGENGLEIYTGSLPTGTQPGNALELMFPWKLEQLLFPDAGLGIRTVITQGIPASTTTLSSTLSIQFAPMPYMKSAGGLAVVSVVLPTLLTIVPSLWKTFGQLRQKRKQSKGSATPSS